MARVKLTDRRYNETAKVEHRLAGGALLKVLVTFGFNETGEVKEVFCADFKAGSDNHMLITDACVLISRLLQHGYQAGELRASLGEPPSLLGSILAAVPLVAPRR